MKKRIAATLLALILILGLCPYAAAAEIFDSSVYLKQQTRSTCTLASVTMLLRRKALLDGDAGWSNITESAVGRVAWAPGLAWNFTYNGVKITVQRNMSSSLAEKRAYLIQMLEQHPEGVVAYARSQPHAVLLTDYDYNTGIFYCCDPAKGFPEGRVELTRGSIRGGDQDAVLRRIDQLWYAASGTSSGAGTAVPLLTALAAAAAPAAPAVEMARASVQQVEVDGKEVQFQMYALKDEQGNDVNYVKLRDMAQALNGSAAQFDISFDGTVAVTTHTAYSAGAQSDETPFQGDQAYTAPAAATTVDGAAAQLGAIQLTDDLGGGHIYYNLRDLGQTLGFEVNWDPQAGICIDTDLSQ